MNKHVLCDASCLISLRNVGQLDLLTRLYGEVTIPPAAQEEFGFDLPGWVRVVSVNDQITATALRLNLGPGESEAIALALEEPGTTKIVLDDLAARRAAQALNLSVIGTIGILIQAKGTGLIPSLSPLLDQLQAQGFYVSAELQAKVRELAGEQ